MNRMRFWVVEMLNEQGNPYANRPCWSFYSDVVTCYTSRDRARQRAAACQAEYPKGHFRVVELVHKPA